MFVVPPYIFMFMVPSLSYICMAPSYFSICLCMLIVLAYTNLLVYTYIWLPRYAYDAFLVYLPYPILYTFPFACYPELYLDEEIMFFLV